MLSLKRSQKLFLGYITVTLRLAREFDAISGFPILLGSSGIYGLCCSTASRHLQTLIMLLSQNEPHHN